MGHIYTATIANSGKAELVEAGMALCPRCGGELGSHGISGYCSFVCAMESGKGGFPTKGKAGLIGRCVRLKAGVASLPESTRLLFGIDPGNAPAVFLRGLVCEIRNGLGLPAGYLTNDPFLTPSHSSDRIQSTLMRRLDAAIECRRAAALGDGTPEDEAIWRHQVAREEKLTRHLLIYQNPMISITIPDSPMKTATAENMSKSLTAASQSAILGKFPWEGSKKRVTCTMHTEALLRKAGVSDPKPLQHYDVSVKRDDAGFLVLDTHAGKAGLVENGDDSLYEPGGLFAGELPPVNVISLKEQIAANKPGLARALTETARAEIAPELAQLCELTCTRTFEISTGPHTKVRVQVVGFEDESLPSPNEREKWAPRTPSDVQTHAAIAALHMARQLSHFEQL